MDTTAAIAIHTALASAAASYDPHASLTKLKRAGDASGVFVRSYETEVAQDGSIIRRASIEVTGQS